MAVALAEEMPVSETIDLERRLRDELDLRLDRVLVNAVLPERLSAADAKALAAVDGPPPEARAAIAASLASYETARAQRSQLARLRRGTEASTVALPHLLTPDVGREDLDRLVTELERKL